jgi:tRNA (guanine-N7-)-methyltransferase
MARRALRKIDSSLDLSGHFWPLDKVPCPWCAATLFDRPAPLEIEVGSGKGLFLDQAAAERVDRNFLGLELSTPYAHYAAARLAKSHRNNARLIHGDALRFFREWLPDSAVAAVHVYFPDPWWKKRHHKRRVMNDGFLRDVQRVLAAGGELHFWTDVEEYFLESLERIAAVTNLDGPRPVDEQPARHELDYRTHFERRMRLHGQPVYRSLFIRRASPSIA